MKKEFLIIAIILIVLGGMYWALGSKASKSTPSVDTTNWQTYRSEKYGFEFKYPGDFWQERKQGCGGSGPYGDEIFCLGTEDHPFSVVQINISSDIYTREKHPDYASLKSYFSNEQSVLTQERSDNFLQWRNNWQWCQVFIENWCL